MVITNVARGFGVGLGLGNEINTRAGVRKDFNGTVGVIETLIGIIAGAIIIIIVGAGAIGVVISTRGSTGILVVILVTSGAIVIGAIASIARVIGPWAIIFTILVVEALLPRMRTIGTRARVIGLRIAILTGILAMVVVFILSRFFFEINIYKLRHRVQGCSGEILADFLETLSPLAWRRERGP